MSEAARTILLHRAARRDITKAFKWYETQRKGLGFEFLRELSSAIETAHRSPARYRVVEDDVRRALVRGFPYKLFFVSEQERTRVVRVLHARRKPQEWRRRE